MIKIKDLNQLCYVSIASLWEITIKAQLKKLTINISLEELFEYIDRNEIEVLQISPEHLITLFSLPTIHNDPFDRIIVSQTISEQLILISKDKGLKKYKVRQQWK